MGRPKMGGSTMTIRVPAPMKMELVLVAQELSLPEVAIIRLALADWLKAHRAQKRREA